MPKQQWFTTDKRWFVTNKQWFAMGKQWFMTDWQWLVGEFSTSCDCLEEILMIKGLA
jgi:hypothetical protein